MEIQTLEQMRQRIEAYETVYVYGAGVIGQMVARYMTGIDKMVEAFLVSKAGAVQVQGIRVQVPEDLLLLKSEYLIVIGANESNRQEMAENLERLGITDYVTFTRTVEYEMRKQAFDQIARQREQERIREKNFNEAKLTVGYLTPGYLDTVYAEKRLIVDRISENEAAYISIPKEIEHIVENEGEKEVLEANKMVCEAWYQPKIYQPKVDVIHTFNQVCITDRPWCASFETVMPRIFSEEERYRKYFDRCMESLQKDNCLGLFALCQNAYDIQERFLVRRCGKCAQTIIDKTIVLHPPQKLLISASELERKSGGRKEQITFLFIGSGFFFKGGREVVHVLAGLRREYDIRLIVVSSLIHSDYFTHTSQEEMLKYRAVLQESEWIEYYERLPNEQVLELCRRADVGLLPSFGDTYGYSVLEMQAAGLPVITSNIRAFPEINNEECGWIVNLPLNEDKCCINTDMGELSVLLERQLTACILSLMEHREAIEAKGTKAYKRIMQMHDPAAYAERLKEIYKKR